MKTNVFELDHPLIEHKMSLMRDKNTGTKEFRELAGEVAAYLCYEAMRDTKLSPVEIETPVAKMTVNRFNEDSVAFIPILRAGMGMLDGVLQVVPNAKIGHIGLYRDEKTLEPVKYYCKVPSGIENRTVFVIDPMLATGGSACNAISMLKEDGARCIKFISILSAPEGIEKLQAAHPDVAIYTAKIDQRLNEIGFIMPGLGDAGDRIFGTK